MRRGTKIRVGLLAVGGLLLVGLLWSGVLRGSASATPSGEPPLPEEMVLDAVIRDFRGEDEKGGHPDFESFANPYITTGLVFETLDEDGKPVFKGKRGQQITRDFKNAAGVSINPADFSSGMGDVAGLLEPVKSDQLTSKERFAEWYRDVPGVNASKVIQLKFSRVPGTSRFVFDSAVDEPYKSAGGFFPINGELWGNYADTKRNFHFTTEIRTKFLFERKKNHTFKFTGDDDVWVFIGGRLVLDLGGLHPKREQALELNRLDWLEDGNVYSLDVFHAERHTTQSNFRIETSIFLRKVTPPPTTNLYD